MGSDRDVAQGARCPAGVFVKHAGAVTRKDKEIKKGKKIGKQFLAQNSQLQLYGQATTPQAQCCSECAKDSPTP